MESSQPRAELKWVLGWALAIALVASIPYVQGVAVAPSGYRFVGLTHNIDDGAVYLSWIRQAADGHVFMRNHFTNEPQSGGSFNVLFLAMGGFARLTHISRA